jgi:hypothetical protein
MRRLLQITSLSHLLAENVLTVAEGRRSMDNNFFEICRDHVIHLSVTRLSLRREVYLDH